MNQSRQTPQWHRYPVVGETADSILEVCLESCDYQKTMQITIWNLQRSRKETVTLLIKHYRDECEDNRFEFLGTCEYDGFRRVPLRIWISEEGTISLGIHSKYMLLARVLDEITMTLSGEYAQLRTDRGEEPHQSYESDDSLTDHLCEVLQDRLGVTLLLPPA